MKTQNSERDAARYQWLKSTCGSGISINRTDYPYKGFLLLTMRTQHVHAATVDEVIDKAMQLTKGDVK